MYLKVHKFLPSTMAEGPGKRACIWVQGCSIHCPGCLVPQTWPPNGGKNIHVKKIARTILNNHDIEGVTFAGGEPFDQAKPLTYLAKILKSFDLSILTFTGYLIEDLQSSENPDWLDLLSVTDILVDGPYMREKFDLSRPWVGSSNQRYHFLTPRHSNIKSDLLNTPNNVEVKIQRDGKIIINGILDSNDFKSLLKNIKTEKI